MSLSINGIPISITDLIQVTENYPARFSISYEKYWEALEIVKYKADFYQKQMIANSFETEIHDRIYSVIEHLIYRHFTKENGNRYRYRNLTRPIYLNSEEKPVILFPDGSLTLEPTVYHFHSSSMNAITNPILVIETLSINSRHYDLNTKLPLYKRIDSMQMILYIESEESKVLLFEKIGAGKWKETILTKAKEAFEINGTTITLEDIYLDIHF